MKAAYYPNVGLEQLVPDQFWIEEECKYDIAAMYGISHVGFKTTFLHDDSHLKENVRAILVTKKMLTEARLHVRYPETTKDKYGFQNLEALLVDRFEEGD
ncbi:hypothetical protein Tco_0598637 [Tanacetum coccineum]